MDEQLGALIANVSNHTALARRMGVLIGEAPVTRLSYIEYQALMLCLAGIMCMGLLGIELTLNRFQVLPLLFPGMFSIRERRFYFFDFEVNDGAVGKKLRGEAKMLARMTLCVVLSYLWQRCVLETSQTVGKEFPKAQCDDKQDCFASELHFMTLVNRQHKPVDCHGSQDEFAQRVVVSCIRFVPPSATTWLMHLAIAHSVTQLNLKCYEFFVWVTGNSPCARRLVCLLIFVSGSMSLVLFFSGVMSEFVSSWLSFVMSFSIPVFLYTVWKTGKELEDLWRLESERVQRSIEEHLNRALSSFEDQVDENVNVPKTPLQGGKVRQVLNTAKSARNLLKMPTIPHLNPFAAKEALGAGQPVAVAVAAGRRGGLTAGPRALVAS